MPATERDNSQEGSVGSREQGFSQLTYAMAVRYRVNYHDGEQQQTSMREAIFASHPQRPGDGNIQQIASLSIYLITATGALSDSLYKSFFPIALRI